MAKITILYDLMIKCVLHSLISSVIFFFLPMLWWCMSISCKWSNISISQLLLLNLSSSILNLSWIHVLHSAINILTKFVSSFSLQDFFSISSLIHLLSVKTKSPFLLLISHMYMLASVHVVLCVNSGLLIQMPLFPKTVPNPRSRTKCLSIRNPHTRLLVHN